MFARIYFDTRMHCWWWSSGRRIRLLPTVKVWIQLKSFDELPLRLIMWINCWSIEMWVSSFKKLGHSRPLCLYFRLFNIVLKRVLRVSLCNYFSRNFINQIYPKVIRATNNFIQNHWTIGWRACPQPNGRGFESKPVTTHQVRKWKN